MFLHKSDFRDFFILLLEETIMNDFAKLNRDLADLNAKVDALLAKPAPDPLPAPPPIDVQPDIDAADAAVLAISAKI